MARYVCIHGHFYQPPRENAWLESIEQQDSAYPYHDWNARITAECYGPNAWARILNGKGQISEIINNYSRISFNLGPTLLAWMEDQAPEVYAAVLEADQASARRFGGHGSALAQVYNHMIMPLASARDKQTQVLWGIADFVHRFGRPPEGMWLAETAVDLDTLEAMATYDIRFTILAPHQAARVRERGQSAWHEVNEGSLDTRHPYLCRLPSGRSIALFFYNSSISHAVAFEGLLNKGEYLAGRLLSAFDRKSDAPQLVHIATDGETYGHHHRYGEMALAYALKAIEADPETRIANYAQFLELHPPTWEVEIHENTAWSCAHGVERWRSDCGCATGAHPGWNQAWRRPLREALDWLRDQAEPLFEQELGKILRDPWGARNDYIQVVLDRAPATLERFLQRHRRLALERSDVSRTIKLLELQRHAMLMYTSCGWFFDDISGIESVQILQYAGRVIQLARELLDADLEKGFLQRLRRAHSNTDLVGDGAEIYRRWIKSGIVDLHKVGAHYALSSVFEDYPDMARVYAFTVERIEHQYHEAGRARLAIGRARITSDVTRESEQLVYAVLHLGDQNISGGVRTDEGEAPYRTMRREISRAFARADMTEVLRQIDRAFRGHLYSIPSLFRDEQRRIMGEVLREFLNEAERDYQRIYNRNAPLIRFVADLNMPLPRAFQVAAEFAINSLLRQLFEAPDPDLERIDQLHEQALTHHVTLDAQTLEFALRGAIERQARALEQAPESLQALGRFDALMLSARQMPFEINLAVAQNIIHRLYQAQDGVWRRMIERAREDDDSAREWLEQFARLAEKLNLAVDRSAIPNGVHPTGGDDEEVPPPEEAEGGE
ncbi:MAG TPA: DUF3536 domain-containing protein [Candidatus Sumerlaeota bacterium]|nr:DUF3536 domain-containing protein [Candidatus Sumerlaeota bacterium]HPK02854.1 DUF3536 domain-containing protein [Candidatus Sumerlaeota bacterium]